jgi:HAD superfamily hydrolase (TIGR01484 family)
MPARSLPTTNNTRLVALDVDGTLAPAGGSVSPGVLAELRRVAEAGVTVVIATGRGWRDMQAVARELPASVYLVLNNGATMRTAEGRFIAGVSLPFGTAVDVCQVYLTHDVPPIWIEAAISGTRYLVDGDWRNRKPYWLYLEGKMPRVCQFPEVALVPPPAQVFGLADVEVASQLERDLHCAVGEKVSTVRWQSKRLGSTGVEVLPLRVTKGAVVAQLARNLRVEAQEAMAVGDDLNDVEMLEWAGRGLAIEGSPQALLDVADDVIESHERVLVQVLHDLVWSFAVD